MLPEEILEQVRGKQSRWVQLHFPDLYGNLKTKTLSTAKLSSSIFTRGLYSSDVSGVYGEIYEEQLSLVADPSTYGTIPWGDATDRLICNVRSGEGRYLKDVRYPLERSTETLSSALKAPVNVKQKVSFYMSDGASMELKATKKSFDGPTKESQDNSVAMRSVESLAFISEPKDSYGAVRQQIVDVMTSFFNYLVEAHHHGDSNNSQQVLQFGELSPLSAADSLATLKMAARSIAIVNVSGATFMPLPYEDSSPNDLTISIASFSKGENVFSDENDENGLSSVGYAFIGGVLEHLNALSFFLNSTTNSYKRLAVSPRFSSAGVGDAYSAISVRRSHEGYNIHLLTPDPLVNPYFALAAVFAAGLDGIKKKLSAEVLSESPVIMSEAQRRRHRVKPLPSSLEDALEALQSDNDFLKGIFSPDLIYAYTELKVNEIKEEKQTPSFFDYRKYFHL